MEKYKRDQKYRARERHIYALVFEDNRVYIGQSVDIKRREGQHKAWSGGWNTNKFRVVPLDTMTGTYAQAEEYEYAWRYKAMRAGFKVYGKPGLIIDARRRMYWNRYMIAWKAKKWPVPLTGLGRAKRWFRNAVYASGFVGTVLALQTVIL